MALYLDASAVRGANPAGNRQPQTAAGPARDRASSAHQQPSKRVWRIFERDPDAVRRPRPQAKMPRRSASAGRLAECIIHQSQQCRRRSCPSTQNREWRGGPRTANLTPRRRAGFAPCSGAAASRTISSLSGDSPGGCSESPPVLRLFTTGEVLSASSRISSRPAAPSARRPRP